MSCGKKETKHEKLEGNPGTPNISKCVKYIKVL